MYCKLLQQLRKTKFITFTRLCLTNSTRNVHVFLEYINRTKYIKIKKELPYVPSLLYVRTITYCPNCHNRIPTSTYVSHMIIQFNIQSILVTSCLLGYPIQAALSAAQENIARKNCHNLHTYTQAHSTRHCTLQHTKNPTQV